MSERMLADMIVSNRGQAVVSMSTLPQNLEKAICFNVSADVCRVAKQLSHSRVDQILKAREFAKLPFETMWIEWPAEDPLVTEDDRKVSRVGVYIKADSTLHGGVATWAWVHPVQRIISICPIGATFNFRDDGKPVADIRRLQPGFDEMLAKSRLDSKLPSFLGRPSHNMWKRLNDGYGLVPSPEMIPFYKEMVDRQRKGNKAIPEVMQGILRESYKDLEGELGFLQSLLVVLNSKNLVEVSEPDIHALDERNKARRRLGRKPLMAFRDVGVSLSRIAKRSETGGAGPAEIRQHIVRGHFKIRHTGIFWWSPFLRGSAENGVVARGRYEVCA